MSSSPPALSFLLMVVSGWVHRHQLIVIEFLQAENRLLKAMLPGGWKLKLVDLNVAALDDGDLRWADYVLIWPI